MTDIRECPECGRSVVPKPSGLCPSCQMRIAPVRGDADAAVAELAEIYEQRIAATSRSAESEIQRLTKRSRTCGLVAFCTMLTVVLIPVSWVCAVLSLTAYSGAQSLVRVMGVSEANSRWGRSGLWLSVLPLLTLLYAVVRGLTG